VSGRGAAQDTEAAALRRRLERLEREHAEAVAKAHEALAAAQDRSYWLDRWNLDLNALMRRPGAAELRAALRAVRALVRLARRAGSRAAELPERVRTARDHKWR
jgi:hypothetical protein